MQNCPDKAQVSVSGEHNAPLALLASALSLSLSSHPHPLAQNLHDFPQRRRRREGTQQAAGAA